MKYWITLNNGDHESLVYQSLLECYKLQNNDKQNWLRAIKIILENFGFQEVWYNCGTKHVKKFMCQLEKSLQSLYEKLWYEKLNSTDEHNKLRTYCKFKTSFEPENYLFTFKNFEKRRLFTQLRISSHDLCIETGRYTRPAVTPISERLCKFCNIDKIEDEFHVIMECNYYEELRKLLFDKLRNFTLIDQLPSDEITFLLLMSTNNADRKLGS